MNSLVSIDSLFRFVRESCIMSDNRNLYQSPVIETKSPYRFQNPVVDLSFLFTRIFT